MDGRTDGHFSPYIIRSTFGSRPKNGMRQAHGCYGMLIVTGSQLIRIRSKDLESPVQGVKFFT